MTTKANVCWECAEKYGKRKPSRKALSWIYEVCACCGKKRMVTDAQGICRGFKANAPAL